MRAFVLLFAMLLFAPPSNAVDGFDMPGSDYANFTADSWFVCRNTCGGEARCQGWSWVKPGIQGPAGRCWLKTREMDPVRNACCNSGLHRNIRVTDLTAENRTDRPGLDYRNYMTNSWRTCEATCMQDQRCNAWSHVAPGIQGPPGRCWLKNGIAHPVANPSVISGVKFQARAGRFD